MDIWGKNEGVQYFWFNNEKFYVTFLNEEENELFLLFACQIGADALELY